MIRHAGILAALSSLALGCSDGGSTANPVGAGAAGGDAGATTDASDGSTSPDGSELTDASDASDPGTASFKVRGSVQQIFVTHADPGMGLEVRDANDVGLATGTADHLGSFVFRKLPPGKGYRVHTVGVLPSAHSAAVDVLTEAESQPDASFYAGQNLVPGTGYITTRDGTTLAAFITLPGPADAGPYPTIVNYSGYDPGRPGKQIVPDNLKPLCATTPVLCDAPSDASALIAAVNGYATVSVNMRGTGCSGGAYDFFERLQVLDGYDIIETVAAQPWVLGHRVGMTGLSYPGISQLFVAAAKPPSLAAITPLSVIGNPATTFDPGGIFNKGFALAWITNVLDKAAPYGQGWEQAQVDAGDTVCEENQLLHDQRFDNVAQAQAQKFYDPALLDPLNPTAFASDIDVPVFLGCAFQDEQTGPFWTTLLDKFSPTKGDRFTMYNGVHADGFAPQVLAEWKAFLDLYVAKQYPSVGGMMSTLAPLLTQQVYGVSLDLPADRWAGKYASYGEALAAWEGEPKVRAIFEDGAKDPIGAPQGAFELPFTSWPPAATTARRWYFQPDGSLADAAPTNNGSGSTFQLDPTAGDRGVLGNGPGIWDTHPAWDWKAPAQGNVVAFTTAPLTSDLVMLGTGSVDLFVASPVDDGDFEVNLTEVRPDGQEMYVQSGWLRGSYRALTAQSTELWPEPSMLEKDWAKLDVGAIEKVRVAMAGFGHVFRKGSRVRIAIDTPGDSRAEWRFELLPFPTPPTYAVLHSATYPSSVALPVIAGATTTTPLPPCPSLRGQPCRTFTDTPNTPMP